MRVKDLSRIKWNDAKDEHAGIEIKCEDLDITLDFTKEQWERLLSDPGWNNYE